MTGLLTGRYVPEQQIELALCLILDQNHMKHLTTILLLLLVISACNTSSNTGNEKQLQLGNIGFAFDLSEAAKTSFDKGFLLLHSFEYDDAREQFRAAQQADPQEVMAYWGLAMSHYKALWGLQNVEEGRKVMKEFGASSADRLAKITNPLEKEFWQSIEILYGEGELKARNDTYVDHMEKMYRQYPDNQEVAAFLALGLMWADYDNPDYLKKSSDIAEEILKVNPTHPGALHYMIHANDNPNDATKAIDAANNYAKVAPSAAHALHMPSHIYVALGMWNKSVASNVESYQASLDRMERKNLSGKSRGYHSMTWLHYSYLQQGKFDEATRLLAEMHQFYQDSTHSDSYLINMQNQQLIETGEWPASVPSIDVNYSKLGLQSKSGMHFFRTGLAFAKGDRVAIIENINGLGAHAEAAKLLVSDNGIALCSSGPTRYAPTNTDIKRTEVVIHQMQAMLAMLDNNVTAVEEQLIAATNLESECYYDSGPPFIAYPSFEQYGEWLLTQNRPEEALVQFNRCLAGRTNRAKSLKGKLAALQSLGNNEEAAAVQQILNQFYQQDQVAAL
ncbi:MAG: hypothetical protein ACI92W_001988 [Paraglaciecola sp.]|jgi:hypothetical protein